MKNFANSQKSETINNSDNCRQRRLKCNICNYQIDAKQNSLFVKTNCNVRAFKNRAFNVWKCPKCSSIHCLEKLNLQSYYEKYPIQKAELSWAYRVCWNNLLLRFKKHGLSKKNTFLDYGCSDGLFIEYLKESGFIKYFGYDPYSKKFRDTQILKSGFFEYILVQDVIEHIEEPKKLLLQIDDLLVEGGYVLIGTPNAENINLNRLDKSDFYNEIHVPYHLHLYSPKTLKSLGEDVGWNTIDFFDRPYHDTPWLSVNTRAWNQYQRLLDGTIDSVYEPIKLGKVLKSPKYLFESLFGYWLSFKTGMSFMFYKPHS